MVKCPRCYGTGKMQIGGCSMEHGINTTCDDYGCAPIETVPCRACGGSGEVGALRCEHRHKKTEVITDDTQLTPFKFERTTCQDCPAFLGDRIVEESTNQAA